jgi:hypothetical protein
VAVGSKNGFGVVSTVSGSANSVTMVKKQGLNSAQRCLLWRGVMTG